MLIELVKDRLMRTGFIEMHMGLTEMKLQGAAWTSRLMSLFNKGDQFYGSMTRQRERFPGIQGQWLVRS